jgi:hypothetical protein
LSNLEARFGCEGHSSVRALRASVKRREAIGCESPTLEVK